MVMDITYLIYIGGFCVIMLFSLGIFLWVRDRVAHNKLVKKITYAESSEELEGKNGPLQIKRWFLNISKILGNITKPKSEEDLSRVRQALLGVGYRGGNAVIIFFGAKLSCALLLTGGFLFLRIFFLIHLKPLHLMLAILLFAVIGFYIPHIWLRRKIAKRRGKLMEGFPDALDMLVVCVEGGMGLDAAVNRVGEEMKLANAPISEEFRLLNAETRLGKSRQDALRSMALRTGLEDMNNLATLLIQTDRFGSSVAKALRVHSDTMRTQRQQRAEEKAAKLPLKLLFPMVFFVFPALFVVILGPAVARVVGIFLNK